MTEIPSNLTMLIAYFSYAYNLLNILISENYPTTQLDDSKINCLAYWFNSFSDYSNKKHIPVRIKAAVRSQNFSLTFHHRILKSTANYAEF